MSSTSSFNLISFLIFAFIVSFICCDNTITYDVLSSSNNSVLEPSEMSTSWLQSAQNMIASPAGHVAVQVAKELLNRSAGNSQVLSLNLTNLLIIILLKILIFAAGMLGAGHWSGYGYGYGRSLGRSDDNNGISYGFAEGEGYLITGFLAAQGAGIDDCLYAAACHSPTVAYEYAKAAKALLDGIEKYEGAAYHNPRYTDLIVLVEKAAYDGFRGIPCNTTVKCDSLL